METIKEGIIAKRYLLLYPDGTTAPAELIKIQSDECLTKLLSINLEGHVNYAFANHMNVMQRLELANYGSGSDKGHYNYYYKGALMFELLRAWLKQEIVERFNAFEIRTPFIFDWNRDDIQGQAGLFSDKIYRVFGPNSEKEFVLRYGGDAGVFSIMRDAQLTYRHLPFRLFEDCQGFRVTQTGEISGIRRGRSFSFPDVHSFCANFQDGLKEYELIHKLHLKLASDLGLEMAIKFKLTEEFFPKVKSMLISMATLQNKPVLLELTDQQRQYWTMKHISYTRHPQKIFHVQLDLEDGERYKMYYTDKEDKKRPLVVIHNSLGSIEKWLVLIIEEALQKIPPILPLWLSPTQLRLIPVNPLIHTEKCLSLIKDITNKIRVDIDDRKESLSKRVKWSEKEWVPYVVIIGDKEMQNDIYPLRIRGDTSATLSFTDITEMICKKTDKMPFKPLPRIQVSSKPRFQ